VIPDFRFPTACGWGGVAAATEETWMEPNREAAVKSSTARDNSGMSGKNPAKNDWNFRENQVFLCDKLQIQGSQRHVCVAKLREWQP
jgi:hypothetical protein